MSNFGVRIRLGEICYSNIVNNDSCCNPHCAFLFVVQIWSRQVHDISTVRMNLHHSADVNKIRTGSVEYSKVVSKLTQTSYNQYQTI
jgi:hypothetical protein